MITLGLGEGFVVYALIVLGGVAVAGLYDAWRSRVRAWNLSEEHLGECSKCGLTFLVQRHENVIRCPRCRTFCSMRRR